MQSKIYTTLLKNSGCFNTVKKEDADRIKCNYTVEHQYEAANELLGNQSVLEHLKYLDKIESSFTRGISDYALDLCHDLLDDETPQIVRVYWFSKGMRDYYLCIDGTGLIRAVDEEMPDSLFDRITSLLHTFYS